MMMIPLFINHILRSVFVIQGLTKCTTLTWMQDNSKQWWPPPNKACLLGKNILLLIYTLNTQSMSYYICLYKSMSLSLSSQSVPWSSSHSLLTCTFFSLPFHNILSVPSIGLNVQSFLKNSFQTLLVRCSAMPLCPHTVYYTRSLLFTSYLKVILMFC